MVANDLHVPFVDLQLLSEQLEISYGPENSKKLHLHYKKGDETYYPEGKDDDTHLSKLGAESIAKLAAASLKKMKTGLETYIK